MTSDSSRASNPPFQTPQPAELQSEENREAVLQRVSEQQGAESDPIETSEDAKQDAVKAGSLLDNIDGVENRHIPRLDSPPG